MTAGCFSPRAALSTPMNSLMPQSTPAHGDLGGKKSKIYILLFSWNSASCPPDLSKYRFIKRLIQLENVPVEEITCRDKFSTLSLCLTACLCSTTNHFNDTWWKDGTWAKKEPFTFWQTNRHIEIRSCLRFSQIYQVIINETSMKETRHI